MLSASACMFSSMVRMRRMGGRIAFHAPGYVPEMDALLVLSVQRTCISTPVAEELGERLEKNTLYGRQRERTVSAQSESARRQNGKRATPGSVLDHKRQRRLAAQ